MLKIIGTMILFMTIMFVVLYAPIVIKLDRSFGVIELDDWEEK